jgi:hypothetical protein
VNIADPSNHRGSGHELIDSGCQLGEKVYILDITLNEPIGGMTERCLVHRPVFREIIDPNHLVAGVKKLVHEIPGNEAGGTGHQYFHV